MHYRMLVPLSLAIAGLAAVTSTFANDTSLPSQTQINSVLQQNPLPGDDKLRAIAPKNRADTQRALDQAERTKAGIQPLPNINLPSGQGVDVEALVKQYYSQNRNAFDPKAFAAKRNEVQGLLYFASFSMPKASLDRAIDQAAAVGAAIVIRGTIKPGDIRGTAEFIGETLKKRNVSFLIDPTLFQKFDIKQVPTLVVLPGKKLPRCEDSMCAAPVPPYWAISGDVTIDYALEAIARSAPASRPVVSPYLAKLRKGGFYERRP